MTSWQAADIEANGLRLHYTRTGGSKPPLVLAHGFSDDGLCWTPVAAELEQSYDVIMVDARGHGRSAAPEQGYGPIEQAEDLAGVIAGLGLRKPFVLGHSMGAISTLTLAALHPDVPGAILLEDPPPWWMPQPSSPDAAAGTRQRLRPTWIADLEQGKTREDLIAQQRARTPGWSEAELGPWADSKLRFNLHALNRDELQVSEWIRSLPRISSPALLITGSTEQGALVSAEQSAALQALVPQLQVAHIADAGHSIRRDKFEAYMAVVRAFLSNMMERA